MQKLLKRTALVRGQYERKLKVKREKTKADKIAIAKQGQERLARIKNAQVKEERVSRREDWLRGQLAPKRDHGAQPATYGTINSEFMQTPAEPKKAKKSGLAEGDRVVVVQLGHKDQGKIGEIQEVRDDAEMVIVKGINVADIRVPSYLAIADPDKTPCRSVPVPIPLSAVRLVAPLPHPETGTVRDVIINEIQLRRTSKAQLRGHEPPERFIRGVIPRISIPYPPKQEPEYKDNDIDTLRIEVEDRTWTPTLGQPPMPPSIVDELRNKYSKFRDRHDEIWLQAKRDEDAATAEKKRKMQALQRTPTQEYWWRKRIENKLNFLKSRDQGKAGLTKEVLAGIGEVMERNMKIGQGTSGAASSSSFPLLPATRPGVLYAAGGTGSDTQPRV